MSDDELIALARRGDWAAIQQLLDRCHKALMKVWKDYCDDMHRRGIETEYAAEKVAEAVHRDIGMFRGQSVKEFCGWSRGILWNWIHARLRRDPVAHLTTHFDVIDRNQERPSQASDREMQEDAFLLALRQLSDLDQALIELRCLQDHK